MCGMLDRMTRSVHCAQTRVHRPRKLWKGTIHRKIPMFKFVEFVATDLFLLPTKLLKVVAESFLRPNFSDGSGSLAKL